MSRERRRKRGGGMRARTALVSVEGGDVGLREVELGDVDLLPGGIPPLG